MSEIERARLDLCAPELIHTSAHFEQRIFMDISLHSGSFWEFIRNILMDVFDRSPLNGSRAGNNSKNQSKRLDRSEPSDGSRGPVSRSSPESGHWLVPRCTFAKSNSLKQTGLRRRRRFICFGFFFCC